VAILSGVLNSSTAVKVNIEIMQAFVWLRRLLVAHKESTIKLAKMQKRCIRKMSSPR